MKKIDIQILEILEEIYIILIIFLGYILGKIGFKKIKYLLFRYIIYQKKLSFNCCMIRMYQITHLEKLKKYENLSSLSYKEIRKLFIKEYPNEYLHNPHKGILRKND